MLYNIDLKFAFIVLNSFSTFVDTLKSSNDDKALKSDQTIFTCSIVIFAICFFNTLYNISSSIRNFAFIVRSML